MRRAGIKLFPVFLVCAGSFIDENNGTFTAAATIVIATFTLTLWLVAGNQLRHAREVERAYVSGGGTRASNNRNLFVLTVENYGKTPATIIGYAATVFDLAQLDLNIPG